VQRTLNGLDQEAEAYFDLLEEGASPFDSLDPALKEQHRQVLLDSYEDLLETYKALYKEVGDIETTYNKKGNVSYTKWALDKARAYSGKKAADRSSEFSFIKSVTDEVYSPYQMSKGEVKTQSIEWLNDNIRIIQIDNLLLTGACVYIHCHIAEEYSESTPTSILYETLSEILTTEDTSQKQMALTCLLESSQSKKVSLALPIIHITQEYEDFNTFKENSRNYINQFKDEKLEDYDMVTDATSSLTI
jgi:hypothetical protein